MNCDKAELIFSDYFWDASSDLTSDDNETAFDRKDGNQTLALLNAWAGNWPQPKSTMFFNNLERVIRQLVPSGMLSLADIRRWVEQHTPRL